MMQLVKILTSFITNAACIMLPDFVCPFAGPHCTEQAMIVLFFCQMRPTAIEFARCDIALPVFQDSGPSFAIKLLASLSFRVSQLRGAASVIQICC